MAEIEIRPITPDDLPWMKALWRERWGSERNVVHGEVFYLENLPGFAAWMDGKPAGLVTFDIRGTACEIISLDSIQPRLGIGSRLIEAVRENAREQGCRRLWLITTNDNLNALRFYQKQGFRLYALRPGAVETARKIKPEIPLVGEDGIPIRDEIELEMDL
jgi:ribosomal protein S18 acetylase RimI-like enzyme